MTRRIDIDFAPASMGRSLRSSAWPTWLIGLMGLGGALLCLSAAIYWQGLVSTRATLLAEIAGLDRQIETRVGSTHTSPAQSLTEPQVVAMNGITAQLNLPWSETLNALEAAGLAGKGSNKGEVIALLELDPDPKNQLIKGLAEARNSEAMLGYIERLKAQTAFAGARLLKHEFTEPDASAVIRFEFEVNWPERAR